MARFLTVRKRPCPSCPYRRDVPSGIWDEFEYGKLPQYDGDTPDQVMAGAFSLFCCHSQPAVLCAGWAGCHDMASNLALRMAVATDAEIDPAAFSYESPVPLFASGTEAAEHGRRDIEHPGPAALRMMAKLRRLQAAASGKGGTR